MADPNQIIAEKAAEAVNPSSPAQAGLMGVLRGKSPGDAMQDQRTHAAARRDPIADPVAEDAFGANFEKALAAKQSGNVEPQETSSEPSSAPTARTEKPSPLSPPKIGKHGHIRQLKEGMAAKEQSWETERATLIKELETLKTAPKQPTPELGELLKENERLTRELTLLDITRSPQFQSKFEQPRKVTIQQAKNIAGEKGAEVETVLAMPPGLIRDQKLEELIAELPASTGAIVQAANRKLSEIDFGRQIEIETAKLGLEDHLKQQERLIQLQKQKQESEFNELLGEWSREVDALNPEKNKNAAEVIRTAKGIFDGQGESKERAAAALNAALLPVLLEEHGNALKELERLKTALSRYEDGVPGGSSQSEDPDVVHAPQSMQERTADFERRLDEKMRRDPTWAQQRRGRLY